MLKQVKRNLKMPPADAGCIKHLFGPIIGSVSKKSSLFEDLR
jgi:hypothetical protein